MANPGLSQQEIDEALRAYEKAGYNKTRAARSLGLARTTFTHRLEHAQMQGMDEPEELSPLEQRRNQDEINRLRGRVKELEQQINHSDDIRTNVLGLTEQPLRPATFSSKRKSGKGGGQVAVLFLSDLHWGETINLETMGGLNAFDVSIARKRYRKAVETAVDLCTRYWVGPKPEAFFYLRGGDMISGEIHEELAKTNEMMAAPAMLDLVEHEMGGIDYLLDQLDCPVEVISVPGNHGRTTKKIESKGYVTQSYDTLSADFLEVHYRKDKRVTFRRPASGDALFKIYNTQFLLTHGDRIGSGGGQGFIGPAATIAKGQKKLADYFAAQNVNVDCILTGHFHTSLKLEYGYANGCLPGPSEYSRDRMRARPKPATQWFFTVDAIHGVNSAREIDVGEEGQGSLYDGLK